MFSSVGLERYLDRVEVTGSNPVTLTKTHQIQITLKNPSTDLCYEYAVDDRFEVEFD